MSWPFSIGISSLLIPTLHCLTAHDSMKITISNQRVTFHGWFTRFLSLVLALGEGSNNERNSTSIKDKYLITRP